MGGMGEMEGRGRKERLGHVGRRETEERWGQQVLLDYVGRKETWGEREEMEYLAPRDQLEYLAPRGQ